MGLYTKPHGPSMGPKEAHLVRRINLRGFPGRRCSISDVGDGNNGGGASSYGDDVCACLLRHRFSGSGNSPPSPDELRCLHSL